jgi:hypothetical protein
MEPLKTRLSMARSAKRPWHEIATMMADEIGPEPRDDQVAAVISTAREATGLSPQILKRHLVLLARVRKAASEMGMAAEDLLSPLFNAQEIAVRLYAVSTLKGADVLRRLAKGELNLPRVRELQARLDGGGARFSPRASARHRRTVNAGVVEIALTRACPRLWGPGSTVKRRPQLLFVGGWPGYEVIGADGSVVAGIDTLFPDSELNHDYLESRLGESLLLAPFFGAFYLAMPPDADDATAARLVETLEWFGYPWVGILSVAGEDDVSVARQPEGRPDPDRTTKYESLKRKYRMSRTPSDPSRRG